MLIREVGSSAEYNARLARASAFDESVAKERGRLLALRAIIENPEQRIRGEIAFGLDYMRYKYPEAYDVDECKEVLKHIPRFHPTEQS